MSVDENSKRSDSGSERDEHPLVIFRLGPPKGSCELSEASDGSTEALLFMRVYVLASSLISGSLSFVSRAGVLGTEDNG
jgi:hypothetical protein